jgi:septal ring factor EnvC (AmiA/AmiB activator)
MNDNGTVEVVEAKKELTLEERRKAVSDELAQIKAQIRQVEEQQVKNQQQLQAAKDRLLSRGLELQGQERLLNELLGAPVVEAPAAQ